jgi:hypothetical protein
MKPPLPKTVVLLLVLLCRRPAYAQVFSNDAAAREANFVTRVVQLDEFIHRFNNDTSSAIRRYYVAHHRPWNKSREQVIRSLFNYTSQRWDSVKVDRFIRRATDPAQPDSLGFMRDEWYADASCYFLYHEDTVKANLILTLQLNPNGTAQWVIAAVKPRFPLVVKNVPSIVTISNVAEKHRFIQPAANETYFAELERDFADKQRLADLFDKRFFEHRNATPFFEAVMRGQIKFIAVAKLQYHYLQVHDWVFTVENFERSSRNAGWLITSIRNVNAEERASYIKKLLGE